VIVIDCPHCGPRESSELVYWGEAEGSSAGEGDGIESWRRALYFRRNHDGWVRERWLHVAGCGRYVEVERHRTSNVSRRPTAPTGDTAGGDR
jgi:heterotetrameric sarcosine oxidase delta subunit